MPLVARHVFFLAFLFLFCCGIRALEVQTASFQYFDINVVGNLYEFGLFSIKFDEEIYRMESFNCPSYCEPPPAACHSCDFSLPYDQCIEQPVTPDSCQDTGLYCSNSSRDTGCTFNVLNPVNGILRPGERLDIGQVPSYTVLWYLIVVEEPCMALKIHENFDTGDPDIAIFWPTAPGIFPRDPGLQDVNWGPEKTHFCPPFTYGTVWLQVYVYRNAIGYVEVFGSKIPSSPPTIIESTPQLRVVDPDHIYSFSGGWSGISSFSFEANVNLGCETYQIWLNQRMFMNVTRVDDPSIVIRSSPDESDYSFSVCANEDSPQPFLVIDLAWDPRSNLDSFQVDYFSKTQRPSHFFLLSLTHWTAYTTPYQLMGDFHLRCGETVWEVCWANRDTDCPYFQPIIANEPPAIFWPLPSLVLTRSTTAARIWDNSNFYIPYFFDDPAFRSNDTLAFYYLLSYDQDGRIRILQPESILPSCSVQILRPPFNSKGEFYQNTTVFVGQEKPNQCNYAELLDFNQKADEAFSNMDGKEGLELTDARFELDVWTQSATFTDCISYNDKTLSSTSQINQTITDIFCSVKYQTIEFQVDPCCNEYLQWNLPCVLRTHNKTIWNYTTVEDKVQAECLNPECVTGVSLEQYYTLRGQAKDKTSGCASITPASYSYYPDQLRPFTDCLAKYLLYPIRCTADSQCPDGRCNLQDFTCIIDRQILEDSFWQCLWTGLDPFIQQFILKLAGLPLDSSASEVQQVFQAVDCVGDFTIDVPGRFSYKIQSDASPDCDFGAYYVRSIQAFSCVEQSCWVPFEFDYRDLCNRIWVPVSPNPEKCMGSSFCNWKECDSGDSECIEQCQTYQGTDEFCGWCEDGLHCVEIPGVSEEECAEQTVCVFPNGTVSPSTSEECEKSFGCNRLCWDPETWESYVCETEEECLDFGGRCVLNSSLPLEMRGNWDREILSTDDLALLDPTVERNPFGVCWIKDINLAHSNPDCPLLTFNFDTGSGFYQKGTQFGCIAYTYNSTNCEDLGGKWIDRYASNEQMCSEYGQICRERANSYNFIKGFMNPIQLNNKTEEGCGQTSGGEWGNKTTWVAGEWVSGTLRTAEWKKRENRTTNQLAPTTALGPLRDYIQEAIDAKLGYSVKTEAYCLYRQMFSVVRLSVCDCLNEQDDACFSQIEDTILTGVTVVCNGRSSSAAFPPNQVYFGPQSVARGQPCQDLSVYSRQTSTLESPPESSTLSTTLFSFSESTNYKYSFKNKHDTFIGQVVGDGIKFSSTEAQKFANVTVCTTVKIEVDLKSDYKYADFAILLDASSSRLDPLNIPVSVSSKDNHEITFCGDFDVIHVDTSYVPVYRQDNWEDADSSAWSQAELFGGYLLASLYLVLVLIGLFELKYLLSITKANVTRIRQRYLVIILIVFAALRSLYFFLLMSGALEGTNTTVDYFFIDFVTILFFSSFITYLLYMWINALFATSGLRQHLTTIAFLINFFIYGFFLGMIIAFELTGGTNDVYWCGQLRSSNPDTSTQDSIKLAYRIVLACLSFLIGVAFFGVGLSLLRSLGDAGNRTKSRKDEQMKRMLLNMTITISIGFILQSIFFLIVELLDISDMAFTVPLLIVVEITPCAVILFSLRPKEADSKTQSTASSSVNRTM